MKVANIHTFEAVRGIQARREFYVAMCTMKSVAKMFTFYDPDIPAGSRAQRILRKSRIPRIRDYIIDNPSTYIFSSLTVSVGGKITFNPIFNNKNKNLGTISMSQDSPILINDGQHRVAAINAAINEMPEIRSEMISVVFFEDKGLKKSQQMFSDLNKNAVKPTKSLGILYDSRNKFSKFIVDLINDVRIFKNLTELEKTTISNRSKSLFTLNGISESTKMLFGKSKGLTKQEELLAMDYWNEISKNIPEWNLLINKKITPAEMRKDYVHANTNMLQAFGVVGKTLLSEFPTTWKKKLVNLNDLDWNRTNPIWEKKVVLNGRMIKTKFGINLAANVILKACGSKRKVVV